ncbi:MAG: competence/damage-inducible protein A [Chloroherpetonaceae bacterium]|nr:competence/damage-inducible protein A [Chloroherpetonaceae bacterium]
MIAEIVTIGDELLIGQVVNTNASFIAKELGRIGIDTRRIITIGDSFQDIHSALADALSRADVVIITGGLGPTHDDITKKAVADFLDLGIEFNEEAFENCKRIFKHRGIAMPEMNRSQGEVIEGSLVFQNSRGTAPGMLLSNLKAFPNRYIVIMPGVPAEMETMTVSSLIPYLKERSDTFIKHTTLLTSGIGESPLAEMIGDESLFLGKISTLAYLPQLAGVKLRISSKGKDLIEVENENSRIVSHITQRISSFLVSSDDRTLEEIVCNLLVEKNIRFAAAESCTGGLLSHKITNIGGASRYFVESYIVYNNFSKKQALGVRQETLDQFGAVSEEVAKEMAKGCLERADVDLAVSITGIAGPGGGNEQKPVGTVWIGLATSNKLGDECYAQKFTFSTDRIRNKELFSNTALNMVRKHLIRFD